MDLDLIFVFGLVMAAFAIPSFVAAYSEKRWPARALIMVIVGGLAIAYAVQEDDERYTFANVDDIIVDVLGRYLN